MSCNLGDLNNGGTATVTLTARPLTKTNITTTANVTGAQTDPNTANNTASATVRASGPTAAGVAIFGRVTTAGNKGVQNVQITLRNAQTGNAQIIHTGVGGAYRFDNLDAGNLYLVEVQSKRFVIEPNSKRVIPQSEVELNFIAAPKIDNLPNAATAAPQR